MLSYCTNVHPAEDLEGILRQLERYALPVRRRLGLDRLGVGLWLPAEVAGGLAADPAGRRRLSAELAARGLLVQTLNAFPYGGFHAEKVKHAVYHPDWTDARRLRYTLNCATVLADLLPEDAEYGSISTLPLGWWRPWGPEDDHRAEVAFEELTRVFRGIRGPQGQPIRLAVEPEPGCVLDTVADAVTWLAGRVDPRYVGLCLDTCHLAVSFADPAETVRHIHDSGLDVVKVQASAALHVQRPTTPDAQAAMAQFAEPRYLHQVREQAASGGVLTSDDLPEAGTTLPGEGPWRIHFHIPLHARPDSPLSATTDVLSRSLAALHSRSPALPHIEVETYTWSVLPQWQHHGLAAGIAEELRWARDHLTAMEAPT